jgi:hypothetical protein
MVHGVAHARAVVRSVLERAQWKRKHFVQMVCLLPATPCRVAALRCCGARGHAGCTAPSLVVTLEREREREPLERAVRESRLTRSSPPCRAVRESRQREPSERAVREPSESRQRAVREPLERAVREPSESRQRAVRALDLHHLRVGRGGRCPAGKGECPPHPAITHHVQQLRVARGPSLPHLLAVGEPVVARVVESR